MAEIKLSDLPYGSLNNLEDNSSGDSGDRRRTGATTFLRFAVEKVFGKDTLDNVAELNGVIVSYRPVAYPSYKNRTAMFEEFVYKINETGDEESAEEKPKKYASFAYKVYIPELECRPAPKSFNDPVLITYPDIYSDVEGTQNLPLELGTLVAVKYEDINNLFNPRIVRKVGGPIQIENIASEAINEAFRKGIPAPLGDGANSNYVAKSKPGPPTEAQQAAADALGVESAVIQAIEAVESGGSASAIRFEPHKFYEKAAEFGVSNTELSKIPFTRNDKVPFSLVASETNKNAFDRAYAVNAPLAMYSTSFGLYQVLGYNFEGYRSNPEGELARFKSDPEGVSYELLLTWFKGSPGAKTAAKKKDWEKLASLYNGPANVKKYAPRLSKEYAAITGTTPTI